MPFVGDTVTLPLNFPNFAVALPSLYSPQQHIITSFTPEKVYLYGAAQYRLTADRIFLLDYHAT